MKKLLLAALLIGFQISAFAQPLIITIPEHRFRIDPFDNIIVIQRQNLDEYADVAQYDQVDVQLGSFDFQFNTIPESIEFTGAYMVNNGTDNYHLFFTRLPLIKIQSAGTIWTSPEVSADFIYANVDSQEVAFYTVGITFIDNYLSSYPKRSYDLEFWTAAGDQTPMEVGFSGMKRNSEWVLNSMYNDPLRIRTYYAHKLWLKMHQPSYLQEESTARAGADVEYVEVFVNGHYSGVYLLSQKINRDLLSLQAYDDTIRGELYKAEEADDATLFSNLPIYDDSSRYWGGYTMIYPREADTTNWQNLYSFTDFVINSDSTEFENIWSHFDFQNYLDYFIFLNLTGTTDNIGKNIYLAKYGSNSPYFFVPWQLNGSFGITWNGAINDTIDSILRGEFMNKVNDSLNVYEAAKIRWYDLRWAVLDMPNMSYEIAEAYNLLQSNNVYERESLVYPNYPFDQVAYEYLQVWIYNRMNSLDEYFNYIYDGVSELSRDRGYLYPNPATNQFKIHRTEVVFGEEYLIVDIRGRVVKSGIYTGEAISVNTIQSGLYLVRMKDWSAKLIVQ